MPSKLNNIYSVKIETKLFFSCCIIYIVKEKKSFLSFYIILEVFFKREVESNILSQLHRICPYNKKNPYIIYDHVD
uniref:Uncharacterized protein n=1 Tax=Panagrolaimus sp. ES5 TaxID=591445 RepID=A0AC34GWX9_9BILA